MSASNDRTPTRRHKTGLAEAERYVKNYRDEGAQQLPARRTINLFPDAAVILGLGRNAAYEAAARGEIPGLIKIGKRYLVSVEGLNQVLSRGDRPVSS